MNIKFGRDGQEVGEYPEEAVPALLQSKVLRPTDMFWHEGLPEWTSVASRWPAPVTQQHSEQSAPGFHAAFPAKQPYEGKATQKQKQRIWELGFRNRDVIDDLGKKQAGILIDQLYAFYRDARAGQKGS